MIKIEELRIGNFVVAKEKGWAVGLIDYFEKKVTLYNIGMPAVKETFKIEDLSPVEVSDEWLDVLGVKHDVNDEYEGYYYGLGCLEHKYKYGQVDLSIECDHIHQLQNAWFVLNKEELKMKE